MALETVTKNISLNVGQPNNFELICAMQGDNKSFKITATLYDVNKLYTIRTDNIKLKGENPAGLTILKNVDTHTANTVTFTLTEDMLMHDGILKLVLVFTENSTQLTTFPFVIKVINSPGNNTADDIKTVSGLVEEAEKWAMLSKSYAVGTNNEVREGDTKDNSKYYYEQIKGLLDSGKIGNGKILYFETYDEFKKELDAGKIENETLICIKENTSIDSENRKLYLYNNGNEYENITGGWTYYNRNNTATCTKESDCLQIIADPNKFDVTCFYIRNSVLNGVSLGDYSKIGVTYTKENGYVADNNNSILAAGFGYYSDNTNYFSLTDKQSLNDGERITYFKDIESLSNNEYMGFGCLTNVNKNYYPNFIMKVYSIWLE